jgi:hypothetical protein
MLFDSKKGRVKRMTDPVGYYRALNGPPAPLYLDENGVWWLHGKAVDPQAYQPLDRLEPRQETAQAIADTIRLYYDLGEKESTDTRKIAAWIERKFVHTQEAKS